MATLNINHGVRPQVLGKNTTNYIYQKDDPGLDVTNISYIFPYTIKNFEAKIPNSRGTSGSGSPVAANPSATIRNVQKTDVEVTVYDESGQPHTQTLQCVTTFNVVWDQGTVQPGSFNPRLNKVAGVVDVSVEPWQASSGTYTTTTDSSGVTDNTHYTGTLSYSVWAAEIDPVTHRIIGYTEEPAERSWSVPNLTYSTSGGDSFGGHYTTINEDLKIFDLTMVET